MLKSRTTERGESPLWVTDAEVFYSRIEDGARVPVTVFTPPDGEVTDTNPGTVRLRLQPAGRALQVLDHEGRDGGVIRSEGVVRGVRYVLRRNGTSVWTLSIRSLVCKRHRLHLADGGTWTFDTPFYWWQHLTGSLAGAPKILGEVGPSKRIWLFGCEPGCATDDLLAAVALLHRNWWRW